MLLKNGSLVNTGTVNAQGVATLDGETVNNDLTGLIDITGDLTLNNNTAITNVLATNAETIEAGASLTMLDTTSITGGKVNNAGTLTLNGSGTGVLLKTGALVNTGSVDVQGGATWDHETVTNNSGQITVDSAVTLEIDTTTITNGTLIVHGTLDSVGTSKFTNVTITITNTGTIQAVSGVLNIDPVAGIDITNSGIIKAANGGEVDLVQETVINTGTLEAINGSIFKLTGTNVTNSVGVDKGTISTDGTSELDLSGSTITGGIFANDGTVKSTGINMLTNVALTNSGTMEVLNGSTLTITGTLLGNGTIQLDVGGKLDLGVSSSSTTQKVVFNGTGSSTLQLDASFDGQIQGFEASDKLDLSTIVYDVHTTATYTFNSVTNSGVLTVSDYYGHSIDIRLVGADYTNAHFAASLDASGHTLITMKDADDAPALQAPVPATADVTEFAGTVNSSGPNPDPAAHGTADFTDVDLLDRPTAAIGTQSIVYTDANGNVLSTLSAQQAAAIKSAFTLPSVTNDNNGHIDWSYSIADGALDFLAKGEKIVLTSDIVLTDGPLAADKGLTDSKSVTVTIVGSNDVPVVTAVSDALGIDSSGTATPIPETDAGLTASGTQTVTDPDQSDTVTLSVDHVTVTQGSTSIDPGILKGFLTLTGAVTSDQIDATHVKADGTTHNVSWSFDSGSEAFNFLGVGETLQLNYSIKAHDSSGATDGSADGFGTISIIISGTNDKPVATDFTLNFAGPTGTGWVLNPENGHYYRLGTVEGTRDQAHNSAVADGAYLATITSQAEQNFIAQMSGWDNVRIGAWTSGYSATASDAGSWQWTDGPEAGSPFTFTHWNAGEPNGGFGVSDGYLELIGNQYDPDGDRSWNDVPGFDNQRVTLEEWGGRTTDAVDQNNSRNFSTATLLAHASDVDETDTTLTVTSVQTTSADGATVTLSGNTVTYDPSHAAAIQALAAGEIATDTFTYTVSDGHPGGTGTATASVKVIGVNDAPTIDAATLPSVPEDSHYYSMTGASVADLFAGKFHDIDHGASLAAVAIIGNAANDQTEGTWYWHQDGMSDWWPVGTVNEDNALVLPADVKLMFVPVHDFAGTPQLVVVGVDDSYSGNFSGAVSGNPIGANYAKIDVTDHGGSTPFSDQSTTISADITAVNDAPHLTVQGSVDIVTANFGGNNLSILQGDGSGGFAAATSQAMPGGTGDAAVALGDVNGDGLVDIVTANSGSNNVSVLIGNGTGGFTASTVGIGGGTGPSAIAVADFNHDGKLDIVTANKTSDNVSVLIGDGAGGFTASTKGIGAGASAPVSVAVGDINGDGNLDIVTANQAGTTANVSVLLGDGSGGFTASTIDLGTGAYSVALGDLNHDGKLDIVTANKLTNNVGVLLGDGAGHFTVGFTGFYYAGKPVSVALGDINGDGDLDIEVATQGNPAAQANPAVALLLGQGDGVSFYNAATQETGLTPTSVAIADVDGDGTPDVVVTNQGTNNVTIMQDWYFGVTLFHQRREQDSRHRSGRAGAGQYQRAGRQRGFEPRLQRGERQQDHAERCRCQRRQRDRHACSGAWHVDARRRRPA